MIGTGAPAAAAPVFVLTWAALGALVGVAMLVPTRRTLRQRGLHTALAATSVIATGAVLALLAARFGPSTAIGPGTALAVVGLPLAMVDMSERRLPSSLIAAGFVLAGGAVVVMALDLDDPAIVGRSALASAAVGGCYLTLALLASGGLGAGDVKLAALTGVVLGATGWSSVVVATAVTWLSAACIAIFTRLRQRNQAADALPLGPSLVAGAVVGALNLHSLAVAV